MSLKPHKARRSDPLKLFQGLQFHGCLLSDFDDGDELRGPSRSMSALGQKRTSSTIAIYVRYWGQSGHSRHSRLHHRSARYG